MRPTPVGRGASDTILASTLRESLHTMSYGHFDDDAREYVITTPHTPYPWINYLGTDEFFGLISHTGGGYTFYRDALMRRLTRFRYNNVPTDGGGRCYYINDGGDIWSPTWAPARTDLDHFEARHGLSYTSITGERGGLRCNILFLVPLGATAEIHRVHLTNTSDRDRSFHLFSLAEFCLWNAADDATNFQRNLSLGEVEVERGAVYHTTEYRERRNHYAVYGVNCDISGFDTDRETFLGRRGEWSTPQAVVEQRSRNSIASGWAPIGSHHIEIDLAPGEARELIFVLGYVENDADDKWASPGVVNKEKASALLGRFAAAGDVDAAMAELRAYWTGLLDTVTISTGDPRIDRTINTGIPTSA